MHFQTFSVVVGTRACNAKCPFCISRQTGLLTQPVEVNWRNFNVACNLAQKANTTTVLMTGKGEPTLYPQHITAHLEVMRKYNFPLIELQTNGIWLAEDNAETEAVLKEWYQLGLTTIAISTVHYDSEMNRKVYSPDSKTFYSLYRLIEKLHRHGFSVRLCVMLLKGYIDCPEKVAKMIEFCQATRVEQLTFRNIKAIEVTDNPEVTKWTAEHALTDDELELAERRIKNHGVLIHKLMHGTDVYDVDGQNVCLGTCLTQDPNQNDFRQLIFFPDGSLYWDWQYKGARIL